jgi:hypothetical protein
MINSVHAEPATLITGENGQAVAGAIEELTEFLSATTIIYSQQMSEGRKKILT